MDVKAVPGGTGLVAGRGAVRSASPRASGRGPRRFGVPAAATILAALLAGAAHANAPDETAWAAVLAARVDDRGLVDYRAIADFDLPRLGAYLASLGRVDPGDFPQDDAIAFWLNAHNALVVLGLAQGYDPARLEDRARLYHWLEIEIGGRSRTLDEIREIVEEHARSDPRIHFAVCPGTLGSPPLAPEPYDGARLDAQLARAARAYVNDPRWNVIDVPARRAVLSPLFRWYRRDFERAQGSVGEYVASLLPDPKVRSIVGRDEMRIEYAEFDWTANAREVAGSGDP